ncbi:MAG: V-type ATPase subunit [Eubacteriales bacterium]|nr:V-type ATPase subunit [Eubacteriales bacterium]
MMRYKEDDYIYGSTRVRAVAARTLVGENIRRSAEAKDLDEAFRIFDESGMHVPEGDIDRALSDFIDGTYKILDETAADPPMFNFLRYPYDCHNIKAAVKSAFRGTDPARLMFGRGSVPADAIIQAVGGRDFSALPHHMASAAKNVIETYYHNSDPGQIDSVMDRACFLDMSETAGKYGLIYLRKFVEYKADTVNILTCVRLIRMNAGADSVERFMVPGGIINNEQLKSVFDADGVRERETLLYNGLRKTRYAAMKLDASDSLTVIERTCENTFLDFIAGEAKQKLYGMEILTAFVILREAEVKNIRIVVSGKTASVPAETIKERLRTYA